VPIMSMGGHLNTHLARADASYWLSDMIVHPFSPVTTLTSHHHHHHHPLPFTLFLRFRHFKNNLEASSSVRTRLETTGTSQSKCQATSASFHDG
jgi:hypothetical protein